MNIFKRNKIKKELPVKIKTLRSWLVNASKGCAFFLFTSFITLFIVLLLREPELVLNKIDYFLYSFANFSILFYLLTMMITFFSYEMYSSFKALVSKTPQTERDEILKIIKNKNPNLSSTEKLCLEHIVNNDKKVSYLSIIKKMEKIKS